MALSPGVRTGTLWYDSQQLTGSSTSGINSAKYASAFHCLTTVN